MDSIRFNRNRIESSHQSLKFAEGMRDASMLDTIIRGGHIVDGTGAPACNGDIGIREGVITSIGGHIAEPAREIINADGALVTPGFVDFHTHYDGQIFWDDKLDSSFSNGVTTVIAGNCGVGFARNFGAS